MNCNKAGLILLLSGMSYMTNADTVLGFYAGAQGWDMGSSGGFADQASLTDFSFDSETNGSFYVALEHPVPLLPNIKLVNTTLDTAGSTLVDASFTFDGELFIANNLVANSTELTVTDYILYYEIFDNDLISVDLGVNGKYLDGSLTVEDSQTNQVGSEDFSELVPTAYSRVSFGLPFTGLGVYAEGSYLAISDSTVSDFQVAVTYSFIESLALDLTLQLGYRDMSIELDDVDDIYSNLAFDGAFAGIEFHF